MGESSRKICHNGKSGIILNWIKFMRLLATFVFLLTSLFLICGMPRQTQAKEELVFPTVDLSSLSHIPARVGFFSISNSGEYLYGCKTPIYENTCTLFNRDGKELFFHHPDITHAPSWSYDNQHFVSLEFLRCQEAGNLTIFETESKTIDIKCRVGFPARTRWSPLDPDILYVWPHSLYHWETGRISSFQPPVADPSKIQHAVGYFSSLWDAETNLPLGDLLTRTKINQNLELESSEIVLCPVGKEFNLQTCLALLNTLNIAPVYPYHVLANGHWLLWVGNLEKVLGQAANLPERASDTIFYMTYLPTGETKEIFRLSQLGQTDLGLYFLAWSPDRNTLALNIGPSYGGRLTIPSGTTSLVGSEPAILLLNLDWSGD